MTSNMCTIKIFRGGGGVRVVSPSRPFLLLVALVEISLMTPTPFKVALVEIL